MRTFYTVLYEQIGSTNIYVIVMINGSTLYNHKSGLLKT